LLTKNLIHHLLKYRYRPGLADPVSSVEQFPGASGSRTPALFAEQTGDQTPAKLAEK